MDTMDGHPGIDSSTGQSMALGPVGLVVADLARVADFYETLGLRRLPDQDGSRVLGAGGRPLVVLREVKGATRDQREAGLFHLALRVPDRRTLAAVLRYLIETKIGLDGLSDHHVSEALYLQDPEGNGIEIYADRPRADWHDEQGRFSMTTKRLDVEGLMSATGHPGAAPLPAGTDMGHVHLESVDPETIRDFYGDRLGMSLMARYPHAVFLARDGYHHHLAGNAWNRRSRPRAVAPMTQGLDFVTIRLAPGLLAANGAELCDPSGVRVRLEAL
ncbi:catechol 2,3-dioxygenase [Arboricoccus pini]|uniref:Catechol 2,3-dioxygenase n=1 Tax=Arboricoccus pini TaxID=1963835 RepID=A0A212Q5A1_9PROT|nr:VOC family protein [Arboricoccus pini]SNB54435.1 catechol 2,3-dioxygenase [Arboricoccus pini]